jgi:hypothetical protein
MQGEEATTSLVAASTTRVSTRSLSSAVCATYFQTLIL